MAATLPDRERLVAAHRRSRAAAIAWRDSPAYRHVAAALASDADAPAEAVADRAARLLGDPGWIDPLLTPLLAALAADPWFEPPLKVSRDQARIGAVLFETAAVSMTATIFAGAAAAGPLPPAATVIVPGRLCVTYVHRSGGAQRAIWEVGSAGADFRAATAARCRPVAQVPMIDGAVHRHDGRHQGQLVSGGSAPVATVSIAIRADASPCIREYSAGTGALCRVAALDDRCSRAQMLAALLRHAGHPAATTAYAALADDPAFFVRWSAMREWLGTDAAGALPRLRAMAAGDPHPDVRHAAATMVPRVAAHTSCPA